jgi:hypothetical protein
MVSSEGQALQPRPNSFEPQGIDASNHAHVSVTEVAAAAWHKSSWSSFNGSCIEVAELPCNRVGVRDTKAAGAGPILAFTHPEWNQLLTKIKKGGLDFT